MEILVFYGDQPCIDIQNNISGESVEFGLNRDRNPDASWSEFRWIRIDKAKRVELTEDLKKILIEDICEYYGGEKAYLKLLEFHLI